MDAQEQLDSEFFTRIDESNAQWYIDRRNLKLFASHSDVQAFLSELQIPFPTKNNALFWTIVYFARRLIFPQDDKIVLHLQEHLAQTGMRAFMNRKNPLKRPYIQTPTGKMYIMPLELYWTPKQFTKALMPTIADAENHIGGEIIIEEDDEP